MSNEDAAVTINDSNNCTLATENTNPVSPIPSTVPVTTGGRKKSLKIISAIIAGVLIIATAVTLPIVLTNKNLTTIKEETTMMTNEITTTITKVSTTGAVTATTTPLNDLTNITFTTQRVYSTGVGALPVGLAVADVNNDRKPDIIVANQLGQSFGILLNMGQGEFNLAAMYTIQGKVDPQHVSVGDINDDGKPDIFVVLKGANAFAVMLNSDNGTFAFHNAYQTGAKSSPSSLTVADINNDKKLDVIIANQNENNIGVFLNPGNSIFTSQTSAFKLALRSPTSPSVVDINGDSKPDIVFANYDGDTVGILFNSGNGTFDSISTYPTGPDSQPRFVSVVDVNQDDKLDIVVANSKSNNVGVLLNSGNGTFLPQNTYSTGGNSNPQCVSVVDLNDDNKPEIIVANMNSNNVGIFFNIGNGTFLLDKTYSTGLDSNPQFVSVIDVNDDGKPDIIVANSKTSNVGVMLAA